MRHTNKRHRTYYRKLYKIPALAFQSMFNIFDDGEFDSEQIDVSRHHLHLPRLSEPFEGYRIVQISDIHFGTWMNQERLRGIVEMVNAQLPDLIAITGDFVTFDADRFKEYLISSLNQLQPKDAAVAVLGNHDHWTDPDIVREVLWETAIIDLSNNVYSLSRDGASLHIAGVDCTLEGLDRLHHVLDKIPQDSAAILLAHEPDFADISAKSGRFDLQISGHSHGGQINLPLIGAPLLPPHGRKYPSGLYRINGMYHYTNRGVGTASMQLRFNCPPEITVFTLRTNSYKAPD